MTPAASDDTATSSSTTSGGTDGGSSASSTLVAPEPDLWTVVNVVDGDTVDVESADGTTERIRVIGIDTPERGECGFGPASSRMAELVLGEQVELVDGARDDRDRYDRLLRYVDVDGVDAGFTLIEDGLAIARYDSRDGYGRHPRENDYVAADAATEHQCANQTQAAPAPAPAPTPAPKSEPEPAPESSSNGWGTSSCDPAYDPCVPPVSEVGDLNCPDIRAVHPSGVSVDHSQGDPHGLDRDQDGHGCEP